MIHLADFIVKRRKAVIILIGVLSLIGTFLFFCTGVNYNILDYLPGQANSTKALAIMEQEFDQPIPNLYVMVEDVSPSEALDIRDRLSEAEYVRSAMWLDDAVDLKVPLEVQDASSVEAYYKDQAALFMVTVEEGQEQHAVDAVREAVGRDCKLAGNAADQAVAQRASVSETIVAIILLVPVIIIILVLSTTSFVEPLLYLLTLAAAVLINLGSNIMAGEISFVTLAAAPVLQIAVSLDYAVFLSNSFAEHRRNKMEPVHAIRAAMRESGKAISASMMTTLFGFLALMFMKFRIGPDMGFSLVKGVLLSFICVMTLLPALLLTCGSWIEKTRHRRFLPEFRTVGAKIMKLHIPVVALLAVIIVPSFLAQSRNHFFYGMSEGTAEGTEGYEVEQRFGKMNSLVLLVPEGESEKETMLCEEIGEMDHVTQVVAYVTMVSNKVPVQYLDESVTSQFYSGKYARVIISADCGYEGEEAFRLVEQIRGTAAPYYPGAYYMCGQSANMYDMKEFVETDSEVVNLITVFSIYLVLLVMTKSYLVPLPLILTIKCSIWMNMAVPYFTGNSLSYIGYLIVSAVQMGATVDYAILLTDNYMENRKRMDKKKAMAGTLSHVFKSILVSAATLTLAGFCLSITSSNPIVQVLGILVGRGAVFAVLLVMLFLPALLLWLDRLIPYTVWGSGPFAGKKDKESVTEKGV